MAQYRLSANIIGRSSGRSATAAAAYRAGVRIVDERTGLVHDYTRKEGVAHAEVIAPEGTPEWMADRAELWNAVEAAEKRKDAQLAREIQLSLPHEMTDEQRTELVRTFCEDQFVSRGMIADIAIHRPDRQVLADDRNHHAHIMLTLRNLMEDGFGNKERSWNDPAVLEEWREAWAEHQNQALEQAGIDDRVTHLSLAAQGILREPQKHLGPIATEIERSKVTNDNQPFRVIDGEKYRTSIRGDENRAIIAKNRQLADLKAGAEQVGRAVQDEDLRVQYERKKHQQWAERKLAGAEAQSAEDLARFNAELAVRIAAFENDLDREFGDQRAGLDRQQDQVSDRLGATGWRRFVRDITFQTRRDRQELARIEEEQAAIMAAEEERRAALDAQNQARKDALLAAKDKEIEDLQSGIEASRQRREAAGWISSYRTRGSEPPPPENDNKAPAQNEFRQQAGRPLPDATGQFQKAAGPDNPNIAGDDQRAGETGAVDHAAAARAFAAKQSQSVATDESRLTPDQIAKMTPEEFARYQMEQSSDEAEPARSDHDRDRDG